MEQDDQPRALFGDGDGNLARQHQVGVDGVQDQRQPVEHAKVVIEWAMIEIKRNDEPVSVAPALGSIPGPGAHMDVDVGISASSPHILYLAAVRGAFQAHRVAVGLGLLRGSCVAPGERRPGALEGGEVAQIFCVVGGIKGSADFVGARRLLSVSRVSCMLHGLVPFGRGKS